MKKKILLLLILQSMGTLLSYGSNVKFELKMDTDIDMHGTGSNSSHSGHNHGANEKDIKIKFSPIDLKIKDTRGKYLFFFKMKGKRENINNVDEMEIYNSKPLKRAKDFSDKYSEFYKRNIEENSVDALNFGGLDEQLDISNLIDEHEGNEEGHNHSWDDKIEEIKNKEILKLEGIDAEHIDEENVDIATSDYQFKMGAIYRPNIYTKLKLTYMPLLYHGKERYYYNTAVGEAEYTKVFDNKFSITLRPTLAAEKFYKPLFFENKTDLRYKINKNTVLGAMIYNGIQLRSLKEKRNIKNSIELVYDYNKVNKRTSEFWQILDHEHEKIEQLKVKFRYSHDGKYLINQMKNKNLPYDEKIDEYETDFSIDYKEPNFLLKGLEVTDSFKFNKQTRKRTQTDKKFIKKSSIIYKKKTSEEEEFSIDEIIEFADYLENDGNRYYTEDKSKFYYYFENPEDDKYMVVETWEATNPKKYMKPIIENNEIKIFNELELKYRDFKLKHLFKYTKTDHSVAKLEDFNSTISLAYEKEFKNGIKIEPQISYSYLPFFYNGTRIDINHINFLGDISYNIKNKKLKLKVGSKGEASLRYRKALEGFVVSGNEKEEDIWVKGYAFSVKPYLKFDYEVTKGINLFSELESSFNFSKEITLNNHQKEFYKSEKNIKYKGYTLSINAGIKYSW